MLKKSLWEEWAMFWRGLLLLTFITSSAFATEETQLDILSKLTTLLKNKAYQEYTDLNINSGKDVQKNIHYSFQYFKDNPCLVKIIEKRAIGDVLTNGQVDIKKHKFFFQTIPLKFFDFKSSFLDTMKHKKVKSKFRVYVMTNFIPNAGGFEYAINVTECKGDASGDINTNSQCEKSKESFVNVDFPEKSDAEYFFEQIKYLANQCKR